MDGLVTSALHVYVGRLIYSIFLVVLFMNVRIPSVFSWPLIIILWFSGVGSTPYEATDYKVYVQVASVSVGGGGKMIEWGSWMLYHVLLAVFRSPLVLQAFSILLIFWCSIIVFRYLQVSGWVFYSGMALIPMTRFFMLSTDWYLRQGSGFVFALFAIVLFLGWDERRRERGRVHIRLFLSFLMLVVAAFFHSTALFYFFSFLAARFVFEKFRFGVIPGGMSLMVTIVVWLFCSVSIVMILRLSGLMFDLGGVFCVLFSWLSYSDYITDSLYSGGVSLGISYVIYGLLLVVGGWSMKRLKGNQGRGLSGFMVIAAVTILLPAVLMHTIALADRLSYPFLYLLVLIGGAIAVRSNVVKSRLFVVGMAFVVFSSSFYLTVLISV